jgi:predicted phage terminase large subunit-like protein
MTKLLSAILRQDLSSFIAKSFYTINPGTTYLPNWHIDLIAHYLEEVTNGGIKRLIINMPPRALKSVCVSVAWPAWILGNNPSSRIMAASYSQGLSIKHSMDSKLVMTSAWYKEIFPETIISKKHNQKSKFLTTQNGFRMATSVGGVATGEGGDFLIIDDPHNPTHIHSKKRRDSVIEWYERTFSTRLNNKKTGAIIIVMQRLHEDDLAGHLSNKKGWEFLKIPAIAAENKIYQIKFRNIEVKKGDILHPGREAIEQLKAAEDELGLHNFSAQYQQDPAPSAGGLLSDANFMFYEHMIHDFEYIVQSWDTAIKAKSTSDYSVCTVWGIKYNKYYLLHMLRDKFEYPALKSNALSLAAKWRPKYILIEDKASGQSLIQDLKNDTDLRIVAIKVSQDKITRFSRITEYFLNEQIYFPDKKYIKDQIIKELTTFPNSKNDDIVDSISQFLSFIKDKKEVKEARLRSL